MKMTKGMKWGVAGIAALVLLVAGLLVVSLSLASVIKVGINTIAPKVTGTKVVVGSIKLGLLRGQLSIGDFELGNPEGYSTAYALKAKSVSVSINPLSLLKDKIIVKEIAIDGVDLYYEQGLSGSNITDIKANVDKFTKSILGEKRATANANSNANANTASANVEVKKGGKKLQVDKLGIGNVSVYLSVKGIGGNALPVPVPPISLSNLGSGPEGITPADLGATILDNLLDGVMEAVKPALPSLKDAADTVGKGAGKVVDGAKGAVDSVLGIFK
jgi:uncharacterized protein involved in outer membrane biogenesis